MSQEEILKVMNLHDWKSAKQIQFELEIRGFAPNLSNILKGLPRLLRGRFIERRERTMHNKAVVPLTYEYKLAKEEHYDRY